MGFLEAAKRVYGSAVDVLFPPRCFVCGELVDAQSDVCSTCWSELDFISRPFCARCGDPFEYAMKDAEYCMACLQAPPPFASARAVLRYGPTARRLIAGFKYYDRTQATPMFGRWLARSGADNLPGVDAIIPVPLHPKRLVSRRYNQAALMAKSLGRHAGKPVWVNGMRRTRHTPQQAGLTRAERLQNVRDAFAPNPVCENLLPGKTILLVDDVMTTGATLNACTTALLDAGAKDVHILTLARRVLD